jgi:hypothetical protein
MKRINDTAVSRSGGAPDQAVRTIEGTVTVVRHEVETDDALHEEPDRPEMIDRVVRVEAVIRRRHFVTDTSGTRRRLPICHVPRWRAGAADRWAETFAGGAR